MVRRGIVFFSYFFFRLCPIESGFQYKQQCLCSLLWYMWWFYIFSSNAKENFAWNALKTLLIIRLKCPYGLTPGCFLYPSNLEKNSNIQYLWRTTMLKFADGSEFSPPHTQCFFISKPSRLFTQSPQTEFFLVLVLYKTQLNSTHNHIHTKTPCFPSYFTHFCLLVTKAWAIFTTHHACIILATFPINF